MANGFSDYVEQKILDWMFKQTAMPSAPTALAISLHSADPGDVGANELANSNGYARVALAPDANNVTNTNWNAKTTSGQATQMSNKLAIAFPLATGNWNGGTAILFFALWDSATYGAGNCLFSGTINGATGVVVLSGNTLSFAAGTPGALTVNVD